LDAWQPGKFIPSKMFSCKKLTKYIKQKTKQTNKMATGTEKKLTFSAIANLETKSERRTNKLNFVRVHLFSRLPQTKYYVSKNCKNKQTFSQMFFFSVCVYVSGKIYFIHLNRNKNTEKSQEKTSLASARKTNNESNKKIIKK
jgi:hypothetical protein